MIVLAVLFLCMQLLLPLGSPGHGGYWLLTFGFLVLAAYSAGELAATARLPKIVGYLAAGAFFGPSAFDVVNVEVLERLSPVSSLAIALIAYLAGAELRWGEVRSRAATIAKIVSVELTLTFVAITGLVLLIGSRLPFMRDEAFGASLAFAMIFASITIVHSPAVTMALLSETKAGGPVARTTLGVVLISDVVVVLLFSGVMTLAKVLAPPSGGDTRGITLGQVTWEILGAILVGSILGGAVALYLRWVKRELFLFSVLTAFFGAVIGRMIHVEVMLMLLCAGFVTENLSQFEEGEAIRHAMERAAAPVFVVFFAIAGAQLELRQLFSIAPLVFPIIVVRLLGIWGGTRVGARWAGTGEEGHSVWLGLVSQAGVAIGLATVVAQAYPVRGAELRNVFLGVMAINQVFGPILFRYALVRSGEVAAAEELEREQASRGPRPSRELPSRS
jgi:Kef-type K+ transport system membrane component KefB